MIQENGLENSITPSVTFRTAVEKPPETPPQSARIEGGNETAVVENIETEPEFSIYENVTGKPYSSEYFHLGNEYDHLSDIDKLSLKEIDSIIRNTIKTKFLKDDKRVAKNILSRIEKRLGLSEMNDPYYRLDRIVKYIKVMGVDDIS